MKNHIRMSFSACQRSCNTCTDDKSQNSPAICKQMPVKRLLMQAGSAHHIVDEHMPADRTPILLSLLRFLEWMIWKGYCHGLGFSLCYI